MQMFRALTMGVAVLFIAAATASAQVPRTLEAKDTAGKKITP
jgi:hypothetical protein